MIEATAVDGPMASGGAKMVDALSLVYMASMYPPAIGSAQVHMHEIATLLTNAAHTVRIGFAPPSRRAAYEHGRPGTQPQLQRHFSISAWLRPRHKAPDTCHGDGLPRANRSPGPAYLRFYGTEVAVARSLPALWFTRRASDASFSRVQRCNLARKWNVPLVINVNHYPHPNGMRYRQSIRLYREADAIIAPSQHAGR